MILIFSSFAHRKVRGGGNPPVPLEMVTLVSRAPDDVPVGNRRGVAAVAEERPSIRAVDHATTRENHLSAFGLIVII